MASGTFQVETKSGVTTEYPEIYMTTLQAASARSVPNGIQKFARFLRNKYEQEGQEVLRVTADLQLELNDRPSRPYVDKDVDLSRVPYGIFVHNKWILPED